jgi:hypothetical protein
MSLGHGNDACAEETCDWACDCGQDEEEPQPEPKVRVA